MENIWPYAPRQIETSGRRAGTEKETSAPNKRAETVRKMAERLRQREGESGGAEATRGRNLEKTSNPLTFKGVSNCKTPFFTCQIVKTK